MKNGPKHIILLGAPLDTGNMGVSALAAGTVTSVVNSFPDARIFLLDYAKEPAKHSVSIRNGRVEVELVNIRFSKKFYLRNNIAWLLAWTLVAGLLPRRTWRQSLLSRNPYLNCILQADLVASLAGGDSFSDIYGLPRFLYMALPQLLILRLGKPLILLPQTLGPFKGGLAKAIGGYIMRRASAVYSRDKTSFEEAGRLLGALRQKLIFSYDMAFVLEPVRAEAAKLVGVPRRNGGTPLVGINISGLLLMGGYTRNNMFGLKADYHRLMHEIVEYFLREHQANCLLVPHVFGDDDESDVRACAQIFQELSPTYPGRIHFVRGDFNQHEIKHLIGLCDFFLGSRMHACIAALSQSVPAVCLAYSRKFVGVMESIGCEKLVIDLCSLDNDGAMASIRLNFAARSRIRNWLQRRMPAVREKVLGLFSHGGLGLVVDPVAGVGRRGRPSDELSQKPADWLEMEQ